MNYKIGMVGLGVMGRNLALNIERHGFSVAGYDLDPAKIQAFTQGEGQGKALLGVESLSALCAALERPRRIILLVPAGAAVDEAVSQLKPHLEHGDILIDGGNSHFLDTERRSVELEQAGFQYVGMGISGGEEGAKWGPALMPGGQREAWQEVGAIFTAIAARAEDGQPCAGYIGPRGAGHYVKMVHNGIEYGDMQLIAEVYDILQRGLGLKAQEIAEIFAEWNQTALKSYLIEITADILNKIDPETSQPLVEVILDEAQQKGTGKWTSQNALDIGAPVPTINAALEGRIISALKSERVIAAQQLKRVPISFQGNRDAFVRAARDALYIGKILSYAQGFGMLKMASKEYRYDLHPGEIARIWRAGCIIRASLLNDIGTAYQRNPDLVNLMLDDHFHSEIERHQEGLRIVVRQAVFFGIPVPAMSASLAYYDAYRSERLPANLTQAQRDYFGAHTYRRTDRAGSFHTDWTSHDKKE